MPPVIVVVANYKGGVGKTTLASLLAVTLSLKIGRRILVVDADPQANITEVFVPPRYYGVLERGAKDYNMAFSLDWIIGTTGNPLKVGLLDNLFLVPSKPEFMRIAKTYVVPGERVEVLRRDIKVKFKDMDYIIFDLPPQMYGLVGPLVKLGDVLISPVTKGVFSLVSLKYLIEDVKSQPPVDRPIFIGAVLTRFRAIETRVINDYREMVRRYVKQAYSKVNVKWELSEGSFSIDFSNILYAHPKLASIRALPFDRKEHPRLIRLIKGELKYSNEVIKIAEPIAKEFEMRVKLSTEGAQL
ncbi:MAG: ParA family protein [Desulfurococcaceae archaeon]